MISFQGADAVGELYVLSYTRIGSGPQLSVFARTRNQSGRWQPSGPHLFDQFTATDDRGASYQVSIRDIGSGPMGWTLMLRPTCRTTRAGWTFIPSPAVLLYVSAWTVKPRKPARLQPT